MKRLKTNFNKRSIERIRINDPSGAAAGLSESRSERLKEYSNARYINLIWVSVSANASRAGQFRLFE